MLPRPLHSLDALLDGPKDVQIKRFHCIAIMLAVGSVGIQCFPGKSGLLESSSAKMQPTDQTSTKGGREGVREGGREGGKGVRETILRNCIGCNI